MVRFDFGVLGGGLIGLSCAWQLARRGVRVAIYDAGKTGAATNAAAGMLAAQCEMAHHAPHQNAENYFDFCLHSRALYPNFLEQLQNESGLTLPLQRGIRYVTTRADDDAPHALRAGRTRGLAVEETEYGRFRALWLRDEGAVEPRALTAALRIALARRGAVFTAGETSLDEIIQDGACEKIVLCSGAWSAQLLAQRTDAAADWLRPVAGLTIEARSDAIREVLYSSDCYVVPRGDGRVVIGATSEERGFEAAASLDSALRLLQAAAHLEPALAQATLLEWRTGLRPVARDGLPVIGAIDDTVFLATAHGRNGVLLAPATAELVANALCDGADTPPEFSPHRFLCVSR